MSVGDDTIQPAGVRDELFPSALPFAPPMSFSTVVADNRLREIETLDDPPLAYRFAEPLAAPVDAEPSMQPTRCHQQTSHHTSMDGRQELDLDSDYVLDD